MGKHLSIADTALLGVTNSALTPASFSGLRAWWKADSLSLSDTDPVSTWLDSSGNGRSVTGTGTTRPLYRTNQYNGLPTVRYDGSNDFLEMAATDSLSGLMTVMVVMDNSGSSTFFGNSVGSSQLRITFSGADDMLFFIGGAFINSSGWASPGALSLFTFKREAANNIRLARNSTVRNTSFPVAGTFDCKLLGTGASPGAPTSGDICEACYWNTDISDANIIALYNSYFKPKWGLP